jgi:Fe-S-cluster containining protein
MLDAALSKSAGRSKAPCRKGCAHCCHIEVAATDDEADLVYLTAKKKGIVLDRERLQTQAGWDDKGYEKNFFSGKGRCVLLSEDGTCGVYDNRPATCRAYFVGTPPEQCIPREEGSLVLSYFTPAVEIIVSAALSACSKPVQIGDEKVGSLAQKLLERLDKECAQ